MKKSNFVQFLTFLMVVTLSFSCQTAADKEKNATDKLMDAEVNLESVENQNKNDSIALAQSNEWASFKVASLEKIQKNENLIADLKIKMKSSNKKMDAVYKSEINVLEQKNNELKARMTTYETNKTDWILFKTEFNKDMEGLGEALNDFGSKNK